MLFQKIQNRVSNVRLNIQNGYARRLPVFIIAIALILSIFASAAGLLYSSNFTPIFFGLAVLAIMVALVGLNKPWYVLYAAIFIVFIPDGLIPPEIQSLLNRGLVVFGFAVWAVTVLLKRQKVYLPFASLMMIAFLTWGVISIFWADFFAESLSMIQRYVLRFILFLLVGVNLIDTKQKLNGLMNTLALIGFLLVMASLADIAIEGYNPGERLKVLGMNENAVGILLLVAMLGVLWWASQPSEKFSGIKKLVGVGYVLISIAIVAMSGSRGSAISMAGTLLVLLCWKSTRFWGSMAVVVLLLGLLAAPFLFATTLERFDTAGLRGDTTLGGREGLWQAAWLMIQDHPVQGVGIGNAYFHLPDYLSDISIHSVLLPTQVWGAESESVHNPILAIWADVGSIGLILYLGILVSAVISFVRSYWRNRHTSLQMYYGLVGAVFVGYMMSWFKGGGMESDHSFFMMIVLLLIPSILEKSNEVAPVRDTNTT